MTVTVADDTIAADTNSPGFFFVSLHEAEQLMTNWAPTRAQRGRIGRSRSRPFNAKFVLFANATELSAWLATELETQRILLDPHDRLVRRVSGRLVAAILEARSPVAGLPSGTSAP